MTHICVSKLTITGSDSGLSPGRRQAIIWTNAEILLIRPLGANFSEILIEIDTFSLKKKVIWKCRLEMATILPRPQGVNLPCPNCIVTASLHQVSQNGMSVTRYSFLTHTESTCTDSTFKGPSWQLSEKIWRSILYVLSTWLDTHLKIDFHTRSYGTA